MKIKITKISELEDALYKNNIEEGFEQIYEVGEHYFEEPMVDRRFNVGTFSSSDVQEIIDKNTFRTCNSIYRWEILETDYEISILKRILSYVLSISLMVTGIYAVSFLV